MNYKIGIDIVYIPRLAKKINDTKFIARILTKKEQILFNDLNNDRRKAEFLAGRFAAKEACSKALKTGIGDKFDFLDVEILKGKNNEPILLGLSGEITIAHDNDYAVANVVLEVNKDENN
ncbi:holo-ACP synthase [Mycoplasma sp. P36-A1]|uniref:holo-ACP synthase n=1 Tax=Mycoplasma sp. P36-A1 TaxID=3252900 RepID=UPI003C2E763F